MKARTVWLAGVLVFLGSRHAAAQVGETVWIPMKDQGLFGERLIKLEATLFKPQGEGPFPVMIFNHGSTGGVIPATTTENPRAFGAWLAAKGVSLIVPMRRGRGKSEGNNKEEPSPCTVEAAKRGVGYASETIDAVYAYLRQQRWAAMDKVILAGHSRGGLLAAVYAAEHPGASIGVVNFSGGWKNDNCGPVDANLVLFSEAGARSRVPNLFLYARGDAFYSDDAMRNYGAAFKAAGGDVSFRLYEVDKINGHQLFHRALPLWDSSVEEFLSRLPLRTGPKE